MPHMLLIVIVFLAGLAIEALGTTISVIGVSSMFGGNLIIIAFILAIDIGKVVTISAAYNYWEKMGFALKSFSILAIVITMAISSSGAAGYFSGEFQKAMLGNQSMLIEIQALQEQKEKYEARKKQIDEQIANLPNTYAAARVRMMNAFKDEQQSLTARINDIETRLPALQTEQLTVQSKAGPILSIAKALDISVETATNFVIGLLILVFNPFAVFLITLANFLIKQRRIGAEQKPVVQEKTEEKVEEKVQEESVSDKQSETLDASDCNTCDTTDGMYKSVTIVVEQPSEVDSVTNSEEKTDEKPVENQEVTPTEPEITKETIHLQDEMNVTASEQFEKTTFKIEPLRETRITKVNNLPNQWDDFKSQLLDENLNIINDGTIIDAFSMKG